VKAKLHGNRVLITAIVAALLAVTGSNCQSTPSPHSEHEQETTELSAVTLGAGDELQVVATTNVLADVVGVVGGDRIALTALMGVGVDPHSYAPTPADVAAVHNAHVVFASGAGLETNLEEMLASAGGEATHIYVSQGLELRPAPEESGEEEEEEAHDHKDGDPHVWFSVPNVIVWVGTIESTLSALDPANAAVYAANARAYVEELEALDAWVMEQVATIPEANRRLVTSHPAFGYLADRYGLELVGAVYPVSP